MFRAFRNTPKQGAMEDNHFPAGFFSFNGTGNWQSLDQRNWDTGFSYYLHGSHLLGKAHRFLSEATRKIEGLEAFSIVPIGETWDGWSSKFEDTDISYDDIEKLIKSAKTGVVEEGSVGGGAGMIAFEFKAGIGSSSREVSTDFGKFTVASMVQANMGDDKT